MRVVLVWNGPADGSEGDPIIRRHLPLLCELTAQGVNPLVALFGDQGGVANSLTSAGIAVASFIEPLPPNPSALKYLPACVVGLRSLLRRHAADLVEGDEPMPAIVAGLSVSRARQVVVFRRHHYGGRRRLNIASRLAARLSDRTMVSCEAMREAAAREDGVPIHRVEVTSSGTIMPEIPIPATLQAMRQACGIAPGERVVVCIARLRREKGIDVLIRAVDSLRHALPVHLVIVGTGPEETALRALAAAGGTSVHFTGHQADVGGWLALGDVIAIPSRRESFGRVTLEAMALGRPIVASGVGGLVDAVTDGEHGLLVAPEDPIALAGALRRLLGDAPLAARLGDAARDRYLDTFTIQHMAKSWRQGWERALSRPS